VVEAKTNTQRFTLYLSGVDAELPDEVLDALYEAGCDDGLVGSCEGVVTIDFARDGESFDEAVRSATADVERAGVGARVERVERIDD
jgi:hypothetical protein